MASFSKPKSRYAIRSISLPSRSHPTTVRIEEELNKLKMSEASSTTTTTMTTAEKICNGLVGLNEVYKCLDEVLNLPLTRKALSANVQHGRWVEESLEASVRLLDVCSITRDFTSRMKERVVDLESAIRRKKGDSRIQVSIAEYFSFRKEMNKGAKKLRTNVKQIDNKITPMPLLDQLEDDHRVTAVIRVLKEVSSISVSVYNSLLSFFSPRISKPKSKCWSKLLDKGRVACEEQKENGNGNELQRVDVALNNIWKCGASIEVVENMKIAQDGLEQLEARFVSIENGLECLFKGLIKARASLLNIISL